MSVCVCRGYPSHISPAEWKGGCDDGDPADLLVSVTRKVGSDQFAFISEEQNRIAVRGDVDARAVGETCNRFRLPDLFASVGF